jgi:hypothetical protein
MQTTQITLEVSHDEVLDDVAVQNLNALIEFALNDLGDSFCVRSADGKEIFLRAKNSQVI